MNTGELQARLSRIESWFNRVPKFRFMPTGALVLLLAYVAYVVVPQVNAPDNDDDSNEYVAKLLMTLLTLGFVGRIAVEKYNRDYLIDLGTLLENAALDQVAIVFASIKRVSQHRFHDVTYADKLINSLVHLSKSTHEATSREAFCCLLNFTRCSIANKRKVIHALIPGAQLDSIEPSHRLARDMNAVALMRLQFSMVFKNIFSQLADNSKLKGINSNINYTASRKPKVVVLFSGVAPHLGAFNDAVNLTGYDFHPLCIEASRAYAQHAGFGEGVKYEEEDIFAADFAQKVGHADVVIVEHAIAMHIDTRLANIISKICNHGALVIFTHYLTPESRMRKIAFNSKNGFEPVLSVKSDVHAGSSEIKNTMGVRTLEGIANRVGSVTDYLYAESMREVAVLYFKGTQSTKTSPAKVAKYLAEHMASPQKILEQHTAVVTALAHPQAGSDNSTSAVTFPSASAR